VESILDDLVERYRDSVLNDLSEFEGLNPSVEHFSRIFGDRVAERLIAAGEDTPDQLRVKIWEDDAAWASHTRAL
jgi:6-pyruvoyl-tetrahydropterin synthase